MAQVERELVRLTYNPLDRIAALAARFENAPPEAVLAWAFAEFGERVAIATGFGAEGMALVDIAVKLNPRPNIFFLDTGFLFPETYALRRRIEERYRIKIRAVRPTLTPDLQEKA